MEDLWPSKECLVQSKMSMKQGKASEAHIAINQDSKVLGILIIPARPPAARKAFVSGCLHSMLEALLGGRLTKWKIPVTWKLRFHILSCT